jgi:UDP-N-acetylmuramyl pentapeptide synthase
MVSLDRFRQELRALIDRATEYEALDILINAGELCRTLQMGIVATKACCEAMREELKPGDLVLIEASAGVGMTVRYRLPRPEGQKSRAGHPAAQE